MGILKLIAVVGLTGMSLASCVEGGSYGGGYDGGYDGGYSGGYGGGYGVIYDGGNRYDRRYNSYPDRRWDDRRSGWQNRRPDRDWQGQRPDRNSGRRDDNRAQNQPRPDRQPDRGDNRAIRDNDSGPYSPDSCGSRDCSGLSTRGSNR